MSKIHFLFIWDEHETSFLISGATHLFLSEIIANNT